MLLMSLRNKEISPSNISAELIKGVFEDLFYKRKIEKNRSVKLITNRAGLKLFRRCLKNLRCVNRLKRKYKWK